MPRLGVVGLTGLDRVDGAPPRVGGAVFYAGTALRLLGAEAILVTKLAQRDREAAAPLFRLGLPLVAGDAEATIGFRIDNEPGGDRRMAIDTLGEPWSADDARGWAGRALARVQWLHAGALTRADFPAETLALLAAGRILSFDGQGLVRRPEVGALALGGEPDPAVLRHVDVLKLGADEAEALGVGTDERSLRSLGVPEVVLTLGRRGAVVYADGLAEHVPARALAGIDPTGAGDRFIAAYLLFRSRGHGPPSAARCATDAVHALLSRWPGR